MQQLRTLQGVTRAMQQKVFNGLQLPTVRKRAKGTAETLRIHPVKEDIEAGTVPQASQQAVTTAIG
jgi:hypothetical protein